MLSLDHHTQNRLSPFSNSSVFSPDSPRSILHHQQSARELQSGSSPRGCLETRRSVDTKGESTLSTMSNIPSRGQDQGQGRQSPGHRDQARGQKRQRDFSQAQAQASYAQGWTRPDAQGHIHLPPLGKSEASADTLPGFSSLDRHAAVPVKEAESRPPPQQQQQQPQQPAPQSYPYQYHPARPSDPYPVPIMQGPPPQDYPYGYGNVQTKHQYHPPRASYPPRLEPLTLQGGLPGYSYQYPSPTHISPNTPHQSYPPPHMAYYPPQPQYQQQPYPLYAQGPLSAPGAYVQTSPSLQSPTYMHSPEHAAKVGRERALSIPTYSSRGSSSRQKRGNHSKQVTSILKEWLLSHSAHPYPSEEEKNQLSAATGLNLSQISNWFINARRRILQPIVSGSGQGASERSHRVRTLSNASSSDDDVHGSGSVHDSESSATSRYGQGPGSPHRGGYQSDQDRFSKRPRSSHP